MMEGRKGVYLQYRRGDICDAIKPVVTSIVFHLEAFHVE